MNTKPVPSKRLTRPQLDALGAADSYSGDDWAHLGWVSPNTRSFLAKHGLIARHPTEPGPLYRLTSKGREASNTGLIPADGYTY